MSVSTISPDVPAATTNPGRVSAFVESALLYPSAPGWLLRVGVLFYVLADRIINVGRESVIVITSVGDLDLYAQFQVGSTFAAAFLCALALASPLAAALSRVLRETSLAFIFGYMILALVSSAWSSSPLLTAFKASQCITYFIAVILGFAGLPNLATRIRSMIVFALAYMVIAYLYFFIDTVPEEGVSMSTLHFVVGAVPWFWVLFLAGLPGVGSFRYLAYYVLGPIIAIETIFTAYVSLTAGLLTNFVMAYKSLSRFAGVIVLGAGLLIMILFLPAGEDATFLGVKKMGDIAGGSGRFEVWAFALLEQFPRSPLIGQGFVVGDAVARDHGVNIALGQLHDSVLSSLLNLGLAGFFLFMAFLFGIVRMVLRHPVALTRRRLAATLVCVLIQQFSGGASLTSMIHPVWIAHLMFYCCVAMDDLTISRPWARAGMPKWR